MSIRLTKRCGRRRQRGMALLVVLWGSTLAAIVLGALAINAHVEGLQARAQIDETQAFYAAQAGLEQAVFSMRLRDEDRRWISDGRPYRLSIGDARVEVSVMDDDGKVNLNQASPALIGKLIAASGVDAERTAGLVDAIGRWGALPPGATGVPQFLAAGGFASIEELQRVPGMTPDIYHRVEPVLTLWQAGGSPNLAHAAPLVVAAVGGVSIEEALAFVEARGNAAGPIRELPPLPGGLRVGASLTASDVLSISSKATLADGVSRLLRVTVRLNDQPGDRRTYRVLRWQVDSGS